MARRTRASIREPIRPKPVEKVELSEKHIKLRAALTILFLLVGAVFIAFGVSSCFSADSGWAEIKASSNETDCSGDFTLLYRLGAGDVSAGSENRALTALYSKASVTAYQLFTADEEFENVCNVAYINRHPNETIQVDPGLYRAFSEVCRSGDRSLYLAPVYYRYDDLFSCTDDSQTADFDPYQNPQVAQEYAEAAAWAKNTDAVDLKLLGGNQVCLHVSDEYLDWAEKNRAGGFIDFFWMKNAFIADYLANALIDGGYTHGCLTSFDGFARNLDESGEFYSFSLYDRAGQDVRPAAVMEYQGPKSLVYLRNYGISQLDQWHYYQYGSGEIRTPYLDVDDGLCKSSRNDLVCLSKEQSCAQVLLQIIPVYIADSFQEEAVGKWREKGISSVYCENGVIFYNDPELSFRGMYQDGTVAYRTELIK